MNRERLTITLDPHLLQAIDLTVDGTAVRNRSHAIEHLLKRGLHLDALTHAVIFLSDTLPPHVPELVQKFSAANIIQCVIISSQASPHLAEEFKLSLQSLWPQGKTQVLPGNFGTATALSLVRDVLTESFIAVEWGESTQLPTSFVPLYTAHQTSTNEVTILVTTNDGSSFAATGVSVLHPQVLTTIPSAPASVSQLFSQVAKAGKLGTYVG